MRKLLIITLLDGRQIIRDYTMIFPPEDQGGPRLGAPANDPFYAGFCQEVSYKGFTDITSEETVNKDLYTHIPASQFKSVQFKFEYGNPSEKLTVDKS